MVLLIGIIFFLLVIVLINVLDDRRKEKEYCLTQYYLVTHKNYRALSVGDKGELSVYYRLRYLEKEGAKFLFNVYVPNGYGNTTEIDIVVITTYGIYVLECKNYGGWIFGNQKQEFWTVTYRNGEKNRFYNPVKQNRTHIQCLMYYLNQYKGLYSGVVFSDRCELKNVTIYDKNVFVGHEFNLVTCVHEWRNKAEIKFSSDEINTIYNILFPLTQIDVAERSMHIDSIRKIHICE